MERGILQFYTSTILNWQKLFETDNYKEIVIGSLRFLSNKDLINIYGFVIMPNHMHLLLEIPETVSAEKDIQHSMMSFTAHEFKKTIKKVNPAELEKYYVNDIDRKYQFWERNPKIKEVSDADMAGSVLDYIHLNPLQEKWSLAKEPEDYKYSSAGFYATEYDEFGFMKHYMNYFNR